MLNLIERLRKQIKKRADIYISRLVSGSAVTFDEYRYLCGVSHAFKEAEEIINKTFRETFEIQEGIESFDPEESDDL